MLCSRAAGNEAFISSFSLGLSFEMTKQLLIGPLPVAKCRFLGCCQVVGLLINCKLVFRGDILPELPESKKLLCEQTPVLVAGDA